MLLFDIIFLLLIAGCFILLLLWVGEYKKRKWYQQKLELKQVVLNTSLGGYYYWDAHSREEFFSENLSIMFHCSGSGMTLEHCSEFFQQDKKLFFNSVECLKSGKQSFFSFNLRGRIAHNDKFFLCSGSRLEDEQHTITGIILWFFDVSSYLKRIKKIISINNHLKKEIYDYMSMLDNLPMPVWTRNSDFSLNYVNAAYKRILYNNDQIDLAQFDELVPSVIPDVQKALTNNTTYNHKHSIISSSGERLPFHLYEYRMSNHRYYIGYAQDISTEEKMSKALAEHISAHNDLLQSSSSAIAIYGKDKELKFYNQAFVHLWGIEEGWLLKKRYYGEVLDRLRTLRRLPEQTDYKKFREKQMSLFHNLVESQNDFFYLPDNKVLRVVSIPHAMGGLLFVYEDITNYLAIERSYNTLLEVQKETLNNVHEGVAVFGEDGCLTLYNHCYEAMWPTEKEHLTKRPHISELVELSKKLFCYEEKWPDFKENYIKTILQECKNIDIKRTDHTLLRRCTIRLPDGNLLVTYTDITNTVATVDESDR